MAHEASPAVAVARVMPLMPCGGCDLRLMVASDGNPEGEIIRQFQMEFDSKKKECAVLIVRATSQSEKWTVVGFNDKGEFCTVVIDDPNHELSKELKKESRNECRIVELATSSLGRTSSGKVNLLIIPNSQEARPQPSFGLREQVRKFIEARAPADISQSRQLNVIGPDYFPIAVTATVVPTDPAEAGSVKDRVRVALEEFLHPLRGGPERGGWEPGRDVFLSDVAAVLERVAGVDFVATLVLSFTSPATSLPIIAGEDVPVPLDKIVVAGDIQLTMQETVT
jgi:hypothetical protein